MISKFFCDLSTHDECSHDWDHDTKNIIDTITSMTTNDPFCPHNTGTLDISHLDEYKKDKLLKTLMDELSMTREHSEAYWQRKLQNQVFENDGSSTLRREILSNSKFVTDLSNRNVLIEIKHHKNFRSAVGQIGDYTYHKKKKNDPLWLVYILLFGDVKRHWTTELWHDRRHFCKQNGIILRSFF